MKKTISFKTIFLPNNQGHGNARRRSLDECSNNLVALMDSDDVSLPHRFSEQLKQFIANDELDVCGGHITEFVGDETNIIGRRQVHLDDLQIKKDLKKRCPMNQVSVMFKKSSYDIAGGYIDWYCEEDYYLWTRMIQKGCVFKNTDIDLVNVRTGLEMSSRRGGWKYFKSERKMQKYLLSNKMICFPRYIYNVLLRFCGEVLAPNWIRNRLFKLLRKKVELEYYKSVPQLNSKEVFPCFSVAMCVYEKDNPEWFDRALKSVIIDQTIKPSEIVLVVDGPIPEHLHTVIKKYVSICEQGL